MARRPRSAASMPRADRSSATHVAERSASSVQLGPDGPLVLGYPDGQWLPVTDRGDSLAEAAQRVRGRMGRRSATATSSWSNARAPRRGSPRSEPGAFSAAGASRARRGSARSSSRRSSATGSSSCCASTPMRRTSSRCSILGDDGVATQFSVDSAAWAETAPLARFRVRGQSLYELGSTPAGAFVDRYDLEAR